MWKTESRSAMHIKKQRHYFVDKGPTSQSYGFSNIHVWMWKLDCKESWALKNWCFWTVVLEKTLESPLDFKEINQHFGHLIGRTDSLEKTLMLRKIEGRMRREQQDEIVGWHHQLNGREFEQAPGVGDRQGSLGVLGPQGNKDSDATEWVNWTELRIY